MTLTTGRPEYVRFAIAALVALLAAPVGLAISLGSSTIGLDSVGAALGLFAVFCAGTFVGWRVPGIAGALLFAVGGFLGCTIAIVVVAAFAWGTAELLFGLFALIGVTFGAVAILGTSGIIYANLSAAVLAPRMDPLEVRIGQALGVLVVGAILVAVVTARIPQQPRGMTIQNETGLVLRIYEHVDGTWRKVGDQDLLFRPHRSKTFVPQIDPRATLAPGGLDSRGCTTRELVVRDPIGSDIAIHPAGLCDGDIWVISAP